MLPPVESRYSQEWTLWQIRRNILYCCTYIGLTCGDKFDFLIKLYTTLDTESHMLNIANLNSILNFNRDLRAWNSVNFPIQEYHRSTSIKQRFSIMATLLTRVSQRAVASARSVGCLVGSATAEGTSSASRVSKNLWRTAIRNFPEDDILKCFNCSIMQRRSLRTSVMKTTPVASQLKIIPGNVLEIYCNQVLLDSGITLIIF